MKKVIIYSIILLLFISNNLFGETDKESIEKIKHQVEIQFFIKQYEESKFYTDTWIVDNYVRQLKQSLEKAEQVIKAQKEYIEKYGK